MKQPLLVLLAASVTFSQAPPKAASNIWAYTPDPRLPNVMIIGDSISIGYTRDVRELLRGKANVMRPMQPDGRNPVNCANTAYGLAHLADWLGTTKWDVIHFNWGLHDLCYRSPESKVEGRRDKIHGKQDVPLPLYGPNLEKLVTQLEQTHARLIWATTTVVPDGEAGRFTGDEIPYNRAALTVINRHHIQIDDLYTLTATFPAELFHGPGDVHYTDAGWTRLATKVAAAIEEALSKR